MIRRFFIPFFVIVLCGALLEFAMRRASFHKNLVEESWYTFKGNTYSNGPGADVIVLGDSRVLHGFDPDAAQDAYAQHFGQKLTFYNAGLPGAAPMTQRAFLQRALTHKQAPKMVMLGISPYMFSSRIVRNNARESLQTLWRLEDLPAALSAGAGPDELSTIFASNVFHSLRYRDGLLHIVFLRAPIPQIPQIQANGFIPYGRVPPEVQNERGQGRGMAYRTEMWKPEATFGNEHMSYFRDALAQLQKRKIPAIVFNTWSASQIELAYGANSIYDEHIAWVKREVQKFGAKWVDLKNTSAIVDADFTDGDHLSFEGARKMSRYIATNVLAN